MSRKRWDYLPVAALAAALCANGEARAQTAEAAVETTPSADTQEADAADAQETARHETTGLVEIVVTARKRSENLQDIPAAIAAMTGEALASEGVRQLSQVSGMTSGFTFVQVGGAQPLISVRGDFNRLGFTEPGTGVFVDGVYTTRFTQLGRGPFDVERVEVLKGPQSTLYGKNTIAGAINIVTAKPSFTWTGSVEAGYGGSSADGEELWHAQAMLSGPLVDDKVAFRAVIGHQRRDGYLLDRAHGYRAFGYKSTFGRVGLLFRIADGVRLTLTASHIRDNAPRADSIRYVPGKSLIFARPDLDPATIPFFDSVWRWEGNVQPYTRSRSTSVTSELNIETGIGDLVYLANYQQSEFDQFTDFDASGIDVATQNLFDKAHAMSHELRLAGSGGGFNWLGGIFYLDDTGVDFGQDIYFGPDSVQRANQQIALQSTHFPNSSKTYAAFGQLGYDVTDRLNILGGLRVARDERSSPFDFNQVLVDGTVRPGAIVNLQRRRAFNSVTGNVVATYEIAPAIHVYASYATGNKSGGFSAAGNVEAALTPYDEQKVTAYELGFKSELLDRALRLNISAYYNRYTDLQVQRAVQIGGSFFNLTQNAASAKVPGVDLEIVAAPTEGLRFNINYSWQDAKINRYQIDPVTLLRDVPIPRSPDHSGSFGGAYTFAAGPGDLTLGGEILFKDDFTNDIAYAPSTGVQLAPLDGYAVANLRTAYAFDGWELSGYVRNLLNKRYAVSAFLANATTLPYWTPAEPRTFELTLKKSF